MKLIPLIPVAVLYVILGLQSGGCGDIAKAKETATAGPESEVSNLPAGLATAPASAAEAASRSPTVRSLEKSPYGNAWFSPDGSAWFADATDGLAIGAMGDATARVTIPNVVSAVWGPDSRTLAITTSPGPLSSEDETLPLFVVHSDGTGLRQIGETDAARRIQYVADGEVAFQYQGDLHIVQLETGADEVVTQLPNDPTNDIPFVFSPDGGSVCLVRGYSVSVLDRSSGIETVLSNTIDLQRWQPCAWRLDSAYLAFADQTEDRHPILHLYDRKTGGVREILRYDESSALQDVMRGEGARAFGGLSWIPGSDWVAFDVDPGGTEFESDAMYEAINVDSGDIVELFRRGNGLRLSPDGRWIGFCRTEGNPADIGEWLAELSFNSGSLIPEASPTAAASDARAGKTFRNEALGVELQYPSSWIAGAPGLPYVSCLGCSVLGPKDAGYPYGLALFTQALSEGCGPTCYVGNRAIMLSGEQELTVAGRQAKRVEFTRQAPLGLAYHTGDYTPYREIWTLVPDDNRALFVVGFYRSDDTVAGAKWKRPTMALCQVWPS